MEGNISVIVFTYEVFIGMAVLLLVLAYFVYHGRAQLALKQESINRLRSQLQEKHNSIPVTTFLKRESKFSHAAIRKNKFTSDSTTAASDAARILTIMRCKWLEAERAALNDKGETNYQTIIDKLAPMYENLRTRYSNYSGQIKRLRMESDEIRKKLKSARSPAYSVAQAGISKPEPRFSELHKRITEQREVIRELRMKLTKLRSKDDENILDDDILEKKLSAAENNASEIESRVELLETALQVSSERYNTAAKELQKLKSKLIGFPTENNSALIMTEKRDGEASVKMSNDTMLDIEQAYEKCRFELKRLQEANSLQRRVVFQLEEELLKRLKDDDQSGSVRALLEKLKLQLRDSEMCTAVLELETDQLRERIEVLRGSCATEGEAEKVGNDVMAEFLQLKEKMEDTTNRSELSAKLIAIIHLITQQQSYEKLALNILKLYKLYGLEGSIYIKGVEDSCWLSTTGSVDAKDKQLLKSVQPKQSQPWVEVPNGVLLLCNHCRLLFNIAPESDEGKAILATSIFVADGTAKYIDGQKKSKLQFKKHKELVSETKLALQHVKVQAKYLATEGKRGVQIYLEELQGLVSAVTMSPGQKRCLAEMMQDHRSHMNLLFESGTALDNSLVGLIGKFNTND